MAAYDRTAEETRCMIYVIASLISMNRCKFLEICKFPKKFQRTKKKFENRTPTRKWFKANRLKYVYDCSWWKWFEIEHTHLFKSITCLSGLWKLCWLNNANVVFFKWRFSLSESVEESVSEAVWCEYDFNKQKWCRILKFKCIFFYKWKLCKKK